MKLSDHIDVAPRFARSINVERDFGYKAALEGYLLTSSGLDVLRRLGAAFADSLAYRAWTLTGPYGSGKSAFALFLADLFSPASDASQFARELLKQHDSETLRVLFDRRKSARIADRGFCPIVVAGAAEPLLACLVDNSIWWIEDYCRKFRAPTALDQLRKMKRRLQRGGHIESREVVAALSDIARELIQKRSSNGIMIIVDELGKFLEYAARETNKGDIFVLQQLAEATPSATGLVLFTILHQSFDSYASSLQSTIRNEWGKVQGRFEDVAFQEPPEQILQLLSHAIRHDGSPDLGPLRAKARLLAAEAYSLKLCPPGLTRHQFIQTLVDCAPLHPVAALALVRLCKKIGQNQRSLFAFLTSSEPGSFSVFLRSQEGVGFYTIADLFDYLAQSLGSGLLVGENGTRWGETQVTLDRHLSASNEEAQVIKCVGMLGAIGVYGNLKASPDVVGFASGSDRKLVKAAVQQLLNASILIFRRHMGAFSLWHGSDVDLEERSKEAVARIGSVALASKLDGIWTPRPVIAKRHSYETGTLRFFSFRFVGVQNFWNSLDRKDGPDGLILFGIPDSADDVDQLVSLAQSSTARDREDIIVAIPKVVGPLKDAVCELEVLRWIERNTPELNGDPTARRELNSRVRIAEERVIREMADLSDPRALTGQHTQWFHRGLADGRVSRGLATFLSEVSDRAYPDTPRLKNELINRRTLSSSAAAARGVLIRRMIEHSQERRLGMEGTPAEAGIYFSVLEATGIHALREGEYCFGPPSSDTGLLAVWKRIELFFSECELRKRSVTELFEILQRPPYGLKMGLIPVILCAAVLAHETEITFYENDAFVPEISQELIERLLRRPSAFAIRTYQVRGVRREVFQQFASLFGPTPDSTNPSLVSALRPLFKFFNSLPSYTRQTKRLSPQAIEVRNALFGARQPDELLFVDLPAACGFSAFDADASQQMAKEYFESLKAALLELQRAYSHLLSDIEQLLCETMNVSGATARMALRERAQSVATFAVEPRMVAFVNHLVDAELDDTQWIEAIGTLLVGKPPRSWNDSDRARYEVVLADLSRNFRHIFKIAFELARREVGSPPPAEIFRIGVTDRYSRELEEVVSVKTEERSTLFEASQRLQTLMTTLGIDQEPELCLAVLANISKRFLTELQDKKSSSQLVHKRSIVRE